MKKLSFLLFCFAIAIANSFAQSSAVIKDYIAKFKDIAIEEMNRTGVPASITLAQGIHETGAGTSKLVLKSNNHFGIKCKAEWKGESVSHDDDARGECFRRYADPTESYKDHSDFLKNRAHYATLFQLDPTDYEGWAHGLKKAGYATNPKYPQILIKLIKDYKLQDYTLVALGRKVMDDETRDIASVKVEKNNEQQTAQNNTQKVYPEGVFQINRTKVIFVPKGTSYLAIAQQNAVPLHRIFEFNDMVEREETPSDGLVFLQRKRREGATESHKVVQGETLYDIAQVEGIQLESLISYNYLRPDVPPVAGRNLYLKKGDARPKAISLQGNRAPPNVKSDFQHTSNQYLLHTVEAKQSLYAISKLYKVSIEAIMQWNNLESTSLKPGQQIRINKINDGTN